MPFDNTAFYIVFFFSVFKANAEALDIRFPSVCRALAKNFHTKLFQHPQLYNTTQRIIIIFRCNILLSCGKQMD